MTKVKYISSLNEIPARQQYVLVVYGEEYAETKHPRAPLHVGFGPCVDGSELARRIFTSAGLVGTAMCSAFECGSHDRWP
jgi:hypothetical protein